MNGYGQFGANQYSVQTMVSAHAVYCKAHPNDESCGPVSTPLWVFALGATAIMGGLAWYLLKT